MGNSHSVAAPSLIELKDAIKTCTDARPTYSPDKIRSSTITFLYSSKPAAGDSDGSSTWDAFLLIFTPCIRRLMRDGINLCHDDVAPKYSFYLPSCSWSASADNTPEKRDVRRYLLEDSTNLFPHWSGLLVVTAKSGRLDILSRFRISDLSMDTIDSCYACADGVRVYSYDSSSPELRINAIYDDIPLKGIWPRPKSNDLGKGSKPSPDEQKGFGNESKAKSNAEKGEESEKRDMESDKESCMSDDFPSISETDTMLQS